VNSFSLRIRNDKSKIKDKAMKQRKNLYLKAVILLFLFNTGNRLSAQLQQAAQQHRHEFSVSAGGGVSSLQFDLSRGEHTPGWGGLAGLGYRYFWDYHWSAGTGIEMALLHSKIALPSFEDHYRFADDGLADGTANLYSVEVRGRNYRESQSACYLQIPLQVQYQRDFGKNYQWYVALGPKFAVPLTGRYTSRGALETKGQELSANGTPLNMDVYTQMPENGFGAYPETSKTGNPDLGLSITGSLEAGVKWKLSADWSLYSGLYLDYGFNNIRKGYPENRVFEYSPQSRAFCPYEFRSVLSSVYTGGGQIDRLYTERVNTLAFGIKVQLAFGKNPFDKKAQPLKVIPPKEPYEGLTAGQMEEILKRNTAALIEEQRREFDALKKLIEEDAPDLTAPVYGFDFDEDEILNLMHPDLDRKVDLLKKYPKANVLLEGHTDDSGNDSYNYKLGLERAEAVKVYLVRHGIAASRLSVSSKGKSEPVIPNADESSRRYNRRVEFILQR
jgi:outer membrane protein OmpA-like peptidoglycan-associated protein